jgi:hypothetical protein
MKLWSLCCAMYCGLVLLQVLQLAVDTARPNIVEVSLDLIHKLIAFRQVALIALRLAGGAHLNMTCSVPLLFQGNPPGTSCV